MLRPFLLAALGCALAAEAASPSTLTVGVLVERARRHQPLDQAGQAARSAAAARARQAATWDNPELEAELGVTRPRIPDLDRDHPYGAGLRQRLDWWTRDALAGAARARVAATEAEHRAARRDQDAEVRLAAIAYAAAAAGAVLAGREAALADELAAAAAARHAGGAADAGELARIRLDAAQAARRVAAAGRAARAALDQLRAWCGGDLAEDLDLSAALEADAVPPAAPATAGHPRLAALDHQQAAAEAELDAARAARWGAVTVGAFAGREADKDTLRASVGVSLPLWDRGEAAVEAAAAERQRLAAERRLAALRLERERLAAAAELEDALRTCRDLAGRELPLAAEAARLRLAAWRAGEAALGDLLEARRAALACDHALIEARRRAAEARVRLGLAADHHPDDGTAP